MGDEAGSGDLRAWITGLLTAVSNGLCLSMVGYLPVVANGWL